MRLQNHSSLARLDQQLAKGEVPRGLHVLEGTEGRDSQILTEAIEDSVSLTDGADRIETYNQGATGRIVRSSIAGAMVAAPGALLGVVGVPGNPMLGAVLGVGVGLALHWDANHKDDRGLISLTLDGESTIREWRGQPENHIKTPAELRTILHSTGILGDQILAQTPPPIERC